MIQRDDHYRLPDIYGSGLVNANFRSTNNANDDVASSDDASNDDASSIDGPSGDDANSNRDANDDDSNDGGNTGDSRRVTFRTRPLRTALPPQAKAIPAS
jgi:hypothetical protein